KGSEVPFTGACCKGHRPGGVRARNFPLRARPSPRLPYHRPSLPPFGGALPDARAVAEACEQPAELRHPGMVRRGAVVPARRVPRPAPREAALEREAVRIRPALIGRRLARAGLRRGDARLACGADAARVAPAATGRRVGPARSAPAD